MQPLCEGVQGASMCVGVFWGGGARGFSRLLRVLWYVWSTFGGVCGLHPALCGFFLPCGGCTVPIGREWSVRQLSMCSLRVCSCEVWRLALRVSVYLWLVGCVSVQGFVDRTAVGRSVYVLQCTTCRLYEQCRTGFVLGLRCAHTCELLGVMLCAGVDMCDM